MAQPTVPGGRARRRHQICRAAGVGKSRFCSTTPITSTTIVTSSTSRTRPWRSQCPGRRDGRADGLEHRDPLINRPATRAPDRPGSSGAPASSRPRSRPPGTPPRRRHGCRDRGARCRTTALRMLLPLSAGASRPATSNDVCCVTGGHREQGLRRQSVFEGVMSTGAREAHRRPGARFHANGSCPDVGSAGRR